MNCSQTKIRAHWLGALLTAHRENFTKLLWRMRSVGSRAGTSFILHRKFLGFLEQVSLEQEKEKDLLHEIEKIEKRHRDLRKRRLLLQATKSITPPAATPVPEPHQCHHPRYGMLKLFGLLMLLSGPVVKHKTQNLTAD